MNTRYLVGTMGVLVLVGAALACGGDGDGGGKLSGVRTQKGLSVAALTEGLTASQPNTSGRGAAVPAEKQSGGVRLDSRAAILEDSDHGPIVVPGHPEKSTLVRAIKHEGAVKIREAS